MFVLVVGIYRWQLKVEKTAEMFGRTLPFMITLLFIPVTRGSPILRLIDVPFEHAVRYHRWLGQLTMILATAHAAIYCMYYGSRQQLYQVCFKLRFQSACIPTLIDMSKRSFEMLSKLVDHVGPCRDGHWSCNHSVSRVHDQLQESPSYVEGRTPLGFVF